MASLRSMAPCVGVSGDFSVLKDFFGYRLGQPRTSTAGIGQPVSILKQIQLLQGKHLHLDLIRVGSDQFLPGHEVAIDCAVYLARKTYAAVGLGIGRISHSVITTAEADGLHQIDEVSQAKKLARKFRGPHDDAMDVFVVLDFNVVIDGEDKVGIAKIDVSDEKDRYHFDGAIMGVRYAGGVSVGGIMQGQALAHEVGHALGLHHTDTIGNLMFPTGTGTSLSADQGAIMRDHDFVEPGC